MQLATRVNDDQRACTVRKLCCFKEVALLQTNRQFPQLQRRRGTERPLIGASEATAGGPQLALAVPMLYFKLVAAVQHRLPIRDTSHTRVVKAGAPCPSLPARALRIGLPQPRTEADIKLRM